MNGYERINAALNGIRADKIPIMLHNFLMAANEAGYSQAEFRGDSKKIAESFIAAIEKYEYDGILVDIDTAVLAGAVGVPVDFPQNEPARTYSGLLEDVSDVDQLAPVDLENDSRVMILLESVRLLKDHFKNEIFIRGNCDQAPFSLASQIRSVQNWMMDLTDEGSLGNVTILLEYCTNVVCQMISLMAQTGADMLSNGDSPAGPSMISPAMYRKFALPYEKCCVDEAHKNGLSYTLHICGDTTLILEDMLQTNSDALELDYQTDIEQIHSICFDKTCFIGNIDPSGVLACGGIEDIRNKTNELVSIYQNSPRFILNAGCAIPQTTPSENLKAMIETARGYTFCDND